MLPGTEISAPNAPLRYTTWSNDLDDNSWDFGEKHWENDEQWKILKRDQLFLDLYQLLTFR